MTDLQFVIVVLKQPIDKNRYCALNLLNQNTIQFRTVKEALKYYSIIAYIEFVYSISLYVKQFNSLNKFITKSNIDKFTYFYILSELKYLDKFIQRIKEFSKIKKE